MPLTMDRFGAGVAMFVLASALPHVVQAQAKQPSAAAKDTARTLLLDCRAKFGQRDFASALKSCQGAHAIMGVPTTGLDLAKVQQAMGLLVEARQTALEAIRFDNSTNNAAFAQAQAEATQIEQDLDKRIPSLVISVSGLPSGTTARILVDTDEVPAAALTLPFRVNPGQRKIVATAKGFGETKRTVTVKEGQTLPIEVNMSPSGGSIESVKTPRPEEPTPKRQIPTWAWIAGGVGLAAAVPSVIFLLQFGRTRQIVARDCPNDQCNGSYSQAEAAALQDAWNRQLALTIASGVVSAAGLGVGIFGIVTAPKKESETTARIVPWISPNVGGAIITGSF